MRESRRRLIASVLGAGVVIVGLSAAPAAAHVSVDPSTSPAQGGYGQVRLVVPTESDTASTTQVSVTIPEEVDLASARTLPLPGWTATIERTTESAGERVSRITWKADSADAAIGADEFGQFTFSGGPWPKDTESVTLPTAQSYSDGSVVEWNEIAVDDASEPERPAPVVALGPASDHHGAEHGAAKNSATHQDSSHDESTVGESGDGEIWFWRVVSLVSLLAAVGALVAVWWNRRPA